MRIVRNDVEVVLTYAELEEAAEEFFKFYCIAYYSEFLSDQSKSEKLRKKEGEVFYSLLARENVLSKLELKNNDWVDELCSQAVEEVQRRFGSLN